MNNTTQPPNEERFDASMRALHRASLARISPQVRWKLQPADAASRQRPAQRSWRLGTAIAGATAAVFALAIGLGLYRHAPPAPGAGQNAGLAAAIVAADTGDSDVYDQDPDFYAWLASDDAELVAME